MRIHSLLIIPCLGLMIDVAAAGTPGRGDSAHSTQSESAIVVQKKPARVLKVAEESSNQSAGLIHRGRARLHRVHSDGAIRHAGGMSAQRSPSQVALADGSTAVGNDHSTPVVITASATEPAPRKESTARASDSARVEVNNGARFRPRLPLRAHLSSSIAAETPTIPKPPVRAADAPATPKLKSERTPARGSSNLVPLPASLQAAGTVSGQMPPTAADHAEIQPNARRVPATRPLVSTSVNGTRTKQALGRQPTIAGQRIIPAVGSPKQRARLTPFEAPEARALSTSGDEASYGKTHRFDERRPTAPAPADAVPLGERELAPSIAFRHPANTRPDITTSAPSLEPFYGQAEIAPVGHSTSSRRTAEPAVHITDLSVQTLPQTQIEQAAAQGGLNVPLLQQPQADNATIQGSEDLVSLVSTDADLRGVLRMIADYHKLNLVVGPDVKGKVTVNIRGATLQEVLDAILGVAGFHWHQDGHLLYVTGTKTENDETLDARVQGRRLQVYSLNYVSATDVEPVVTKLLTPIGQVFKAEADEEDKLRTREVLVVEDKDSGHARIAQYLAQVDIMPPQVLVEAHVLQVDLENDYRHGVDFQAIGNFAGAKVSLLGTNFATTDTENPAFAVRIDGGDMDQFIEAIRSCTNSRTLASPKVSVVNRQAAKVQIGQRLPYAVATTTQTATVQNVQFLDVGIVLTVTPVITEEGNILMTVLPKVSGGRITESGFPEEDTTEVSTTVLMPDGGGLVIGGLIRETDAVGKQAVPILGDIPIVRRFFKKDVDEKRRNELVVALVTHILHDAQPAREKEWRGINEALPGYARSELYREPTVQRASEPVIHVIE